jgi:hypothetical protein
MNLWSFCKDYFYHNISNTPFTLGIVFPNKYGKYRVNGGLEVNDPQNRKDGNGRKYQHCICFFSRVLSQVFEN